MSPAADWQTPPRRRRRSAQLEYRIDSRVRELERRLTLSAGRALAFIAFENAVGVEPTLHEVMHRMARSLSSALRGLKALRVAGLIEGDETGYRLSGEFLPGSVRYKNRQPIRLDLRARVYERDGRRCRYCGSGDRLALDHLVPYARGGATDERNLVTVCQPCNSRKGSRTPEEAGMFLLFPWGL